MKGHRLQLYHFCPLTYSQSSVPFSLVDVVAVVISERKLVFCLDSRGLFVLKYSQRFHICDTVTALEVSIRRVFVWRLLGCMEVEATACMSERFGESEMFGEDSRITLGVLKVRN